jgi:predicted nucleotidyltransferase
MTALKSLAEDVGTSDRTLRRAVNQGTVRAIRPTPRTLKLPLGERQYVRRSWKLLSALRRVLRTEPNVRFAMLFGSTAAGTDTRASDIDLLVEMRDARLERLADLSEKLTAAVGRPLDVVRLEDAQSDPLLLAEWVAEGRVLVDREGSWTRLLRRQPELQRLGQRSEAERAERALAGIDRMLAR